jgi:hypothetical protein
MLEHEIEHAWGARPFEKDFAFLIAGDQLEMQSTRPLTGNSPHAPYLDSRRFLFFVHD